MLLFYIYAVIPKKLYQYLTSYLTQIACDDFIKIIRLK